MTGKLLDLFWRENELIGLIILQLFLCGGIGRKKNWLWKAAVILLLDLLLVGIFKHSWVWSGEVISAAAALQDVPIRLLLEGLVLLQMLCTYAMGRWDATFFFTLMLAAQKLEFSIYKGIEMVLTNTRLALHPAEAGLVLFNLLLLVLVSVLMRYLLRKNWKRIHIHRESRPAVIISLILIYLAEIVNFVIYTNIPYYSGSSPMIAIRVLFLFFYGVMMLMLYNLVDRRELLVENAALEAISRQREVQYAFSKDLIDTINIKSHDLKKQVRYLKKHEEDEAALLDELEESVEFYDAVVRSENETLSTILTEKSMVCRQNHIPFSCIADGSGMDFMKQIDIYTLFANLMDNGIEASMRVEEGHRSMELIVRRQGQFLSVHEENYFSGEVSMRDGMYLTSKEDRRSHGFGTKSMRQIVEKYDGTISMQAEGNIFYVNILIPIP